MIVLTTFDTDDMVVRRCGSAPAGSCSRTPRRSGSSTPCGRSPPGEPILSPTVTAQLIASVTSADSGRATAAAGAARRLTEREREVAVAIGRGLSNAEIAAALYLSVPTVKTHVSRLLAKLDADNRVQIALIVHDAGLG